MLGLVKSHWLIGFSDCKQSFKALPAGGAFVALEWLIDDDRTENTVGLAMSLNMLVETGHEQGYDYTFKVGTHQPP